MVTASIVVLRLNPSRARRKKGFVQINADGNGGMLIITRLIGKHSQRITVSIVVRSSHPMAIAKEYIAVMSVI
jgi:hypothetical protein